MVRREISGLVEEARSLSRPTEDTHAYTVYTEEGRGESVIRRRRDVCRRVEDLKGEMIYV